MPQINVKLPWYIFVRDAGPLITSMTIPDLLTDSKGITLSEQAVPGLNYQPVIPGGNANRKIAFTLPIVSRMPMVGNTGLLAMFEMLRNQVQGIAAGFDKRFNPNPKVLYSWGVGAIALPCIVSKVDFSHRGDMVNSSGQPQYTDVSVELTVDESDPLFQMEDLFRQAMVLLGQIQSVVPSAITMLPINMRPY